MRGVGLTLGLLQKKKKRSPEVSFSALNKAGDLSFLTLCLFLHKNFLVTKICISLGFSLTSTNAIMKGKILFVDLRESIPARDDIDVAVATIFINISCLSPGPKLKKTTITVFPLCSSSVLKFYLTINADMSLGSKLKVNLK